MTKTKNMKKITLFIFTIFTTIITAQSVAIGNSSLFSTTSNSTWTHVITLTLITDGAESQAAQTLEINITNLPAGAQYRVYKTTANGGNYFGSGQDLAMGNNTITVNAVTFDRAVKIQFNNDTIEFDSLSVNGENLYPGQGGGTEDCVGTSALFTPGSANYPYVLTSALTSDGASSQGAQTLQINITSLPQDGANYQIVKTVSNGNTNYGNAVPLSLGLNTITVTAVSFNRTVRFRFDSAEICYSSLVLNGTELLGLDDLSFSDIMIYPNPATDNIYVEGAQNIKSIKVYSILGSLEKEVFNTNQVDISDLSTGIHLIKVDNGTVFTKKIIKQ